MRTCPTCLELVPPPKSEGMFHHMSYPFAARCSDAFGPGPAVPSQPRCLGGDAE